MSGPPATGSGTPARRLLVGSGDGGWVWTAPENALLVIGPPRSGKTRGVVIPNVAAAPGPVVSTSTKPDVVAATVAHRAAVGTCRLFNPTAWSTSTPPGPWESVHWSPVMGAEQWDQAVLASRAMVAAVRPERGPDDSHWTERAGALLAPLLHAAAVSGEPVRRVVAWVNRHEGGQALTALEAAGSELAVDLLAGILATDDRELSGIWSTASGVLSAYRTEAALASGDGPPFDADAFVRSRDTLYVTAPGTHQAAAAPVVSGLVETVRAARYRLHAGGDAGAPPLVLALDEVANIAPLPELPALVSEGGSQGVLTLACLQDMSQAKVRWGAAADGFLTTFGAKLVFPGISDPGTLRAVCLLGGDVDVRVPATTWTGVLPRRSLSLRRQPRIDPAAVRSGRPGRALFIEGAAPPGWVAPTPLERWPAAERRPTSRAGSFGALVRPGRPRGDLEGPSLGR